MVSKELQARIEEYALQSRQGVVEDLSQQCDLAALEPGGRYENRWTVTIF